MTLKNKWNRKTYKIIKTDEKTVTLEREDGKIITISRSELNFNYAVEK